MSQDPVAIVVVNYNMPERTDALFESVMKKVDNKRTPFDFIIVDNGSDIQAPSKSTTLGLEYNVQTTNGWLMGLHYADALATIFKKKYFAYWILITSGEFLPEEKDILTPMVEYMRLNEQCVGIHPALSPDSTTTWDHLKYAKHDPVEENLFRPTWMIDNIAALWRADWFDSIGRFDPEMIYAWGSDLETCYLAREQQKEIMIYNGGQMRKVDNIGYAMDRMNMSTADRRTAASANMDEIMTKKYGQEWKRLMGLEVPKEEK